jgi:hypothetical protein
MIISFEAAAHAGLLQPGLLLTGLHGHLGSQLSTPDSYQQAARRLVHAMVGRPPVVAVRGGTARVLIRREDDDDLVRRDVGL